MALNRRDSLKLGAATLAAGTVKAAAASDGPGFGRAKSVVLIYLQGGAPTQDMVDMKPLAPNETGGEFRPVASSVPGIDVCEHLPKTARWMHKTAVVRSVYHNGGCHNNLPMYTGFDVNLPDEEFRDNDPPSMGSVCAYLARHENRELPTYAYLPCPLGWGEARKKAGPHGGFLGRRYDAFATECTAYVDQPPEEIFHPQTVRGEPRLTDTDLLDGITPDRLKSRKGLVSFLDGRPSSLSETGLGNYPREEKLAFDMLISPQIREAFDISRERDSLRDRYGRTLFGNTTILARRLVERGVQFINVSWDNFAKRYGVSRASWDTHERNFPMLKDVLLPDFDQTYSAFLADLDSRGLLDQTLVVTMGEMGRTPRINAKGGRDHWTECYSVMFAGAGIQGGTVYGASDEQAAYIKDRPVHVREICATINHLLGINPEMLVYDRSDRPIAVAQGGTPVLGILR